jgi:hypothetical protein
MPRQSNTRKSNTIKSNIKRSNDKQDIHKQFKPNKTPKQVFKMGAFGGTYFRSIHSSVTDKDYTPKQAMKGLPKYWFKGLDIDTMVASSTYDKKVNKYKVKCGSSLEAWESSGWIDEQDPYGWFQWFCRYKKGRRTSDDERQIGRWLKLAGPNGRFRRTLMNKIIKEGTTHDDFSISPVIRQVLLHWGYQLTKKDLDDYKKSK